jgi:HD-GYP domain-containing protein (c-di-GMP phosphodiesterase class II)
MLNRRAGSEGGQVPFSERNLSVESVQIGMFVCRLDRPWDGTPFPMQGVLIEREEQIEELAALCDTVTVDIARSRASMTPRKQPLRRRRAPPAVDDLVKLRDRMSYRDTATLAEEMPRAKHAQQNLHAFAMRMIEQVRAGLPVSAAQIDEAVEPVVQSVLRCADAVFWLNSLRERSDYDYAHALNCTTLAVALGRHLGFPQPTLVQLASGGLLFDVGKAQLPVELLSHPGALDAEQQAQVRLHVDHGLAIIAGMEEASPEVRAMVAMHHERMDGSGYPHGLVGTQIPLFGRIAAIIDSFDAMTSNRPYCDGISRHEALQQLYRERNTLYQAELVEQFTQCIGVYPTGSLVELSSGEVAIVMAQNRQRHLCPRVMLLTGTNKQLAQDFREVDLINLADNADVKQRVRVLRPLPPGAYGLNPSELFL